MSKYLYGASVQGIQSFIFETNKLKEIAGASQLIDNISSINWANKDDLSEFEEYCKPFHKVERGNIVMSAAGNIKYKIDKEDDLKKIVKGFPKHIENYAPGVTISQAVVEIEDENDIQRAIDDLEVKLKAQRNVATMPIDIGFMGLERARRTGGVAYDREKEGKEIDRGIYKKTELREEDTFRLFKRFTDLDVNRKNIPFDLKEITKIAENNSWIAIIHADGNGLGKVLTNMSKTVSKENREKAFKTFSKLLDIATEKAAKRAFAQVIHELKKNEKYPIRPVVLGGDDLTVIIRADLAYDFTKAYLKAFEEETTNEFKVLKEYKVDIKGLAACAGIAYIKGSYPFHYGIHLAESLVKEAKDVARSDKIKQAKGRKHEIPSSIAFYKVQSSFTDELKEMKKRTHYAEQSEVSFDYGPYFMDDIDGYANVKELDDKLEVLQDFKSDKSKGISKLRQYISELYKDKSKAKFMMDRISNVNAKFYEKLGLEAERKKETMLLNDLIQLHTFKEA